MNKDNKRVSDELLQTELPLLSCPDCSIAVARPPCDAGSNAFMIQTMPEQDLDKLLAFMHSLREEHAETAVSTLAAESALAKDWLTPEEDAAWANL